MSGSNPALAVRIVASTAELKKALAEGKAEIVSTTSAMSKIVAAYDGDRIVQKAHNVTSAIAQVGGASTLTAKESARINAIVTEGLEKYAKLGREAPPSMLALAEATRRVDVQTVALTDRLASWSAGLKSAGLGLSAAITAPLVGMGAAVVKFGMDAVESENLVKVSFGGMKAQADAWSKQLSAQLGLNQFELRKTAGTIFTMTSSMGLAKDQAFDMSTGVAQLAADMASFRNIGMDEALLKIRSGLTGEAEPLKALGILVDENTVKAYAYKAGIAAQGAELTNQQKVLARWGAILQQTANDQGDLARTLDSPANQLRILRARMEEAATALGVSLMPTITALIHGVADLAPKLQAGVEWFSQLPAPVKNSALAVAAIAAATGPALYGLGAMAGAVRNLLPLLTSLGAINAGATLTAVFANPALLAAIPLLAGAGIAVYQFNKNLQALEERGQHVGQTLPGALDGLGKPLLTIDQAAAQAAQSGASMGASFKMVNGHLVAVTAAAAQAAPKVAAVGHAVEDADTQTKKHLKTLAEYVTEVDVMNRALARGFSDDKDPLATYMAGLQAQVDALRSARAVEHGMQAGGALTIGVQLDLADAQNALAIMAQESSRSLSGVFQSAIASLPSFVQQAFTGGGGIKGALQALTSQIGSGLGEGLFVAGGPLNGLGNKAASLFGDAFGLALPGIGAALGSLVGPLMSKIFGGASQAELEGRKAVRQFEQGIAAGLSETQRLEAGNERWKLTLVGVRDAYLAIGHTAAEAEAIVAQLYAAERQGPEAVAAVQASIQGVLDQAAKLRQAAAQFGPSHAELQQMARDAKATYDYMLASGQYTAEQLEAAFKASQEAQAKSLGINVDAQQASLDMLRKGLTELTAQRDQLWNQIAAEAPEDVMGVVEAGQRAQLATLDKQIEAQNVKLAAQAEEAASALDKALSSIEPDAVHVPVVFDYTNPPSGFTPGPLDVVPMADGGFGTVDKPTLFLAGEAGREEVAFSGANKTLGGGSLGGGPSADAGLRQELAALRRDFKQLPQLLGLAMKSNLRQVRVRR